MNFGLRDQLEALRWVHESLRAKLNHGRRSEEHHFFCGCSWIQTCTKCRKHVYFSALLGMFFCFFFWPVMVIWLIWWIQGFCWQENVGNACSVVVCLLNSFFATFGLVFGLWFVVLFFVCGFWRSIGWLAKLAASMADLFAWKSDFALQTTTSHFPPQQAPPKIHIIGLHRSWTLLSYGSKTQYPNEHPKKSFEIQTQFSRAAFPSPKGTKGVWSTATWTP